MDDEALSVAALLGALHEVIDAAVPDAVWVEGQIQGLTRSRAGHVYFDLVDPDDDPRRPAAKLPVALFARDRQRVERALADADASSLADGLQVRIKGGVSLYVARSQVQLVMRQVDPAFTLGGIERARRQLLASLEASGLLRRQAGLALPVLPRRVALVTSAGSAACADALHELETSGLGWQVALVDTLVQGTGADASIARAVATAADAAPIVLVVRGGGSRTDLAAFDAVQVAEAIARAPVPVWTGIGHEIDRAVADEVAHRAHKTPTACAAALVAHVQADLERARDAWQGIERSGRRALERASGTLVDRAHAVDRATALRLRTEQQRLGRIAHELPRRAADRTTAAAKRLELATARLDAADPARQLARGWSLTTLADGTPLRSVTGAAHGDLLRTHLADGVLTSTVSTTDDQEAPRGR